MYFIKNSFKFLTCCEVVEFKTGPSTGRLVVDCVAFYRYALSDTQILSHYSEGTQEVNISQIVSVDNGYLFSMNTVRNANTAVPLFADVRQVA